MYIYKCQLSKNIIGNQGQIDQMISDFDDFELNYKSQAQKIDSIFLAETTFIIQLSYTDFKAKIVSPILWNDVKYVEDGKYVLNFLSSNPI